MNALRRRFKLNLQLSIRVKIMALVAAALSISLLSYLLVGRSLIQADKISYIYDYSLSSTRYSAAVIENEMKETVASAQLMGKLVSPLSVSGDHRELARVYDEFAKKSDCLAFLILRPADERRFQIIAELGPRAPDLKILMSQLGWTPRSFRDSEVLVGPPQGSSLPLGGRMKDVHGDPLAFLMMLKPREQALSTVPAGMDLFMVGPGGKTWFSRQTTRVPAAGVQSPAVSGDVGGVGSLWRKLQNTQFSSGTRVETLSAARYIASYQKLGPYQLTLIGLIPEERAFSAVRTLIQRSMVLGLSILFIALGVTLFFVKTLTTRLKQMWHATQQISQGDFSFRVECNETTGDELSGLARSFNTMASRIRDLMKETAQKARMEKELETAQVVQGRYFPASDFVHPSLRISGQFVPASECSGDWWYYAQVGDQVLLMLGDVTGHGVSAALVTAAVHANFSSFAKRAQRTPEIEIKLSDLVSELNDTVLAAAGKTANMTCIFMHFNLATLKLTLFNGSHPFPLFYRRAAESGVGTPLAPLRGGRIFPLGEHEELEFEPLEITLQAGDRIYVHTDGISESRPRDDAKIRRAEISTKLTTFSDAHGDDARKTCSSMMNFILDFFGHETDARPDDITFIVIAVPLSAQARASLKCIA